MDKPSTKSLNEDQFGDYLKKGPKMNNFGSGYVKSEQSVPDSDGFSSSASSILEATKARYSSGIRDRPKSPINGRESAFIGSAQSSIFGASDASPQLNLN